MGRNLNVRMFALLGLVASLAGVAPAFASDPYSSLIGAVDFSSVTTDVIAVAALVVVVLVAIRAVRFIFQIVRR